MATYSAKTPTEQVVANSLQRMIPNRGIKTRNGYTYIDGSLIPSVLSTIIARAQLVGRLIRPNRATNEKFTAAFDPKEVNYVTVQLQNNMGITTRTLRGIEGEGTPGNDGLINLNPKLIASTTPFSIPLLNIDDNPIFFPQMMLQTMLFDEVSETIANYMDNQSMSMDTYHMARAIAYSCYRARNDNPAQPDQNIIAINQNEVYDQSYMIKAINKLDSIMSNGDPKMNAMTYNGPRVLVARNELIGWMKTPQTGFLNNASDIGQKMILGPNFDDNEVVRFGSQYRGNIRGYDLMEAPQATWSFVEQWLSLNPGDLNGVLGIVFTPLAYASGGVGKKNMTMLQSTEHDGVVAFPYIKFGGDAYRRMVLIVDDQWTMPASLAGNTVVPVKAPAMFGLKNTAIIQSAYGGSAYAVVMPPESDVVPGMVVSAPLSDKASGAYEVPFKLKLKSPTAGSEIHYTTDGTDPTQDSELYSGPINITAATTIKAIGYKYGYEPSPISAYEYTVKTT